MLVKNKDKQNLKHLIEKTIFTQHVWNEVYWGRIFSCVRPFYEQAVSDLDP